MEPPSALPDELPLAPAANDVAEKLSDTAAAAINNLCLVIIKNSFFTSGETREVSRALRQASGRPQRALNVHPHTAKKRA